ncbi:MAG: hypothetical protein IPM69_12380 [Ignavibacteria bacterium]|nr:hypothetical protein [Ignavibacteria bacterium]
MTESIYGRGDPCARPNSWTARASARLALTSEPFDGKGECKTRPYIPNLS